MQVCNFLLPLEKLATDAAWASPENAVCLPIADAVAVHQEGSEAPH